MVHADVLTGQGLREPAIASVLGPRKLKLVPKSLITLNWGTFLMKFTGFLGMI